MTYHVRYLKTIPGEKAVWYTYTGSSGKEEFRTVQGAEQCATRLLQEDPHVACSLVKRADHILRWFDRTSGGTIYRDTTREDG
jgi:hypothetical protein